MATPVGGLQDSYLATLELSTSGHLNIYNKEIVGLPEIDSYDITISKWTDLYQELENDVSTFIFKWFVLIVTARDASHANNEVKNIIISYPSITEIMLDSRCKIM